MYCLKNKINKSVFLPGKLKSTRVPVLLTVFTCRKHFSSCTLYMYICNLYIILFFHKSSFMYNTQDFFIFFYCIPFLVSCSQSLVIFEPSCVSLTYIVHVAVISLVWCLFVHPYVVHVFRVRRSES